MSVLAIDAGTTGVTALVIAPGGTVAARGYTEFPQLYPRPGWVEHDPQEIWQATIAASRTALAGADASSSSGRTDDPGPVTCVGITNQRETVVIWDRADLAPPRPAIVWQDRRTARICDTLRAAGHEERVTELTGLRLDPYFTGTKLTWLAEQEPAVLAGLADGSLAAGTVDSYLIARLTGGRRHVTDGLALSGLARIAEEQSDFEEAADLRETLFEASRDRSDLLALLSDLARAPNAAREAARRWDGWRRRQPALFSEPEIASRRPES